MAGYNPERAVSFWQEMAKIGGAKPPEFISTHPSDQRRIAQIQAFLPEAQKYYASATGASVIEATPKTNQPAVSNPQTISPPAKPATSPSPSQLGVKIK